MESNKSTEKSITLSVSETETKEEKPGYKTATIVLAIALVAVTAAFLCVRFFEQKSYSPLSNLSVPTTVDLTPTKETSTNIININTADKNELMSLPGIGESKADAIIEYRNNYGAFASVDDITEVSGIGEKALEQLREYICAN